MKSLGSNRQQVTIDIYNNLHDVILTELAPHMRRYAQLRKRVLGLDKMLYCDIEAPLDPEFNPETTYEQASEIVLAGVSVLGPEYREIIATGLKNRWVDRADNVGKATGAFCSSVYGVHPYVCMTWSNKMRFYPYSYSAGLIIGTAVAKAIQEEGAPAAKRWVEVLKAGGTKKPLELAKMAGVDMTSKEPIRKAVAYVCSLVDEVVDSY